MKCEKRSLALLSSKRTKEYTRTKADEAFALPTFSDAMAAVPTRKDNAEDASAFSDDAIPMSVSAMATKPSKSSNMSTSDHDVERLKQTMLHHEFMFQEQLYELHRLYQVQKSLMAEWSRHSAPATAAAHRHPDPDSSLLHNPDVCNTVRNRIDVSHGVNNKAFLRQIDINMPAEEDVEVTDAPCLEAHKIIRKQVFDLERPAKEYLDDDEVEEKPLIQLNSESKGRVFLRDLNENNGVKEVSHKRRNWMEEHYRGSSNRIHHNDSFNGSTIASATESSYSPLVSELNRQTSGMVSAAEVEQQRSHGFFNTECGPSKLPHWISQVSPELQCTQPPLQFVPLTPAGKDYNHIPFSIYKHGNCNQFKTSPCEQTVTGGGISVLQGQAFPRGIFPTSGTQEIQRMACTHNNNNRGPLQSYFIHCNATVDSSIASTKQSANIYASSFETCAAEAPHSMLHNKRGSDVSLSTSNWVQQTACLSTDQQSSKSVSLGQQTLHVSSVNPCDPLQGMTPNAPNKWTQWLDHAIREPAPQSMVSMKGGGATASVFDIEETTDFTKGQVIFSSHGREDMEERKLLTQGSGNHHRYDQTHLPKSGFDLNALSDEPLDLDEENVDMEASVRNTVNSGKTSSTVDGKQQNRQSSIHIRGSTFLDCAGKEHASEVGSSVTQLQEDFPHFSKNTVKNAKCFCDGSDPGALCEVKSSDGSGLTSCDSREAAPQTVTKAIEDSNASSGDQSGNSSQNVVETKSLKLEQSDVSLCRDGCELARHKHQKSLVVSEISGSSAVFQLDLNEEYYDVEDVVEITATSSERVNEAAEVLLRLGTTSYLERSLRLLADVIPTEESNEMTSMDIDDTGCSELGKALDSFELAVLMLKPSVIEDIKLNALAPPVERHDPIEESNANTLRRRSSRRGRANKDFQRDVLPNIAHLSRQEIIEDLQMVEGLIKSATEITGKCVSSSKDPSSTKQPELGPIKNMGKLKGSKSCRGSKQEQKALLRFCSWGESTRRKRMRRQRSQWLCLPPVS